MALSVSLLVLLIPYLTSAAMEGAAAAPAAPPAVASNRGLVIVLRPENVDEITRTALARVVGELTAARFEVKMVSLDAGQDTASQVEAVEPESGAIAAFAIVHTRDTAGDAMAIWVCERTERRTTVERMSLDGADLSRDVEHLALVAIELIRASVVRPLPTPSVAARASARAAPGAVAAASEPSRPELALAFGAGMMRDRGASSTQWTAAFMAMAKWRRGMAIRLQVDALGPTFAASTVGGGGAALHREVATLGPAWVVSLPARVELFASMAAGIEHVSAAGSWPDPMRPTHTLGAWSGLLALGMGGWVHLASHISAYASVDGLWALRSVDLEIAGVRTPTFARPAALINAGARVNF